MLAIGLVGALTCFSSVPALQPVLQLRIIDDQYVSVAAIFFVEDFLIF